MFKVRIETKNAAFDSDDEGGEAKRVEVARILRELADRFEQGSEASIPLFDANGNKVGRAEDR